MTKQQYFEMCEMLGNEPLESEVPIEFEDFPLEVQEAYQVYNTLNDNWEGMSGSYLGKNYAGIKDIMEILGIEDKAICLQLIQLLDSARIKLINSKKKSKSPPAS